MARVATLQLIGVASHNLTLHEYFNRVIFKYYLDVITTTVTHTLNTRTHHTHIPYIGLFPGDSAFIVACRDTFRSKWDIV